MVSADLCKTASMKVRNIPVLCLLFLQSSAGNKREWQFQGFKKKKKGGSSEMSVVKGECAD